MAKERSLAGATTVPGFTVADILEETGNQQDSAKGNKNKEGISKVPFLKLFSFADSSDIILMSIGTIAAIGNGVCMPLLTVLLGNLVNYMNKSMSKSDSVRKISEVSRMFVYLALGSGCTSFLQLACWMITGERQATRMRSLYLKTILRQDIGFFDKESNTGEIIERMSGDTILIQDAIGEKVGNFVQLLASFLGGFTVAFIKGWLLTLALLSLIPPLAISGALMHKLVGQLASRGQISHTLASNIVEQTISSIRTVASFTGEKKAIAKYEKSLRQAYDFGVKEGLAAGLGLGTLLFILFCSYGFAAWLGGKMILERGYTGGDVINVMFALLTGSLALGQTSLRLNAFSSGQVAAAKMFEAINRKPVIDTCDSKGLKLDDIRGEIELRNVYFSYPTRPDEQIFRGFSLFVPSGTTAALVGESGSGKSTVISLIERFFDPQAGKVLIDGVNLKKFQLKWIREKISLVSQEPVLFTSSIRDNIAYGKDAATVEEIEAAADLGNAAGFINKLPQGLDTMVGEHGIQLSGGQKQRIAIARAVLKDPRILLLDEATSALDAESERIVQEALDRVMVNRTTVLVAHRLTTVRNAGIIAVVHQGKVVEKGLYSELLKNPDGAFNKLNRWQEIDRRPEKNVLSSPNVSHHSLWRTTVSVSPRVGISETVAAKPFDITTEEAPQPPQEVPLRRLATLNSQEIPVLLLGSIAAAVGGTILPIFGLLLSSIIKAYYEKGDKLRKDSRFWALIFVLLGSVSLVATPLRTYFFAVAGCKLIKRIRSMCFEKVVNMEIAWFDKAEHSSGEIGARLSTDAAAMRGLVGDTLGLLVQNTATAIAGFVIAFQASWQLALVILALLPLMGFNGYLQMKSMQGFSAKAKKMYEEATQVASDAVGSVRTVASFCAEEKVVELYQKKCDRPLKAGIKRGFISGIGFGISCFFLYFVYAVSFYAGAQLVDHGKTTFSEVFRAFFALSMAALGVSQSSSLAPDVTKGRSSAASVFEILDQKSEIDPSNNSGKIIRNVKGDIKFHHVSFRYPTRPDIQIFRDLCLSINSGKVVALVGESGSGKSTVISLLQRFYDPDSGKITLDGVEIRKLKLKWYRKLMGLVSQEPVLFNDTIRANIAYGKERNATEAEIIAAAELANAHSFISGLQQGYDTWVGERGVQLSGGQKQRVAIARAIVKDPKILLLDEATSALDSESERVVQGALEQVMVSRTTLVVAHRLSTIKGADTIAVVKDGVIVEKGRHNSLTRIKNGVYASLVALHASG